MLADTVFPGLESGMGADAAEGRQLAAPRADCVAKEPSTGWSGAMQSMELTR